jgi:replicative DNA helicase
MKKTMESKLQPQAVDMEEAVLGALMLETEAILIVKDFMSPDYFYKDCNQRIFKAIVNLHKRRDPIDIMSVVLELKSTKELDIVGGAYYISTLTNRVSSAGNIEYHARIVYQKFLQREMIRISSEVLNDAYEESIDIIQLISSTISDFRKVENKILDEGTSDGIDEVIDKAFNAMDYAKTNKGVLGHPIGIKSVDDYLCGLQNKTVYVIAARPGMGKSALVKTIFVNLAKQKIKVKLFSLEVSAEKFMMNIMSDILETNNRDIFQGNLSDLDKLKLRGRLEEIKNYMDIDDKAGIYISYFEKKVKKAVKDGCQVVMIDYLQLMNVATSDCDPKNRERQISFLTGNIKRIANENNIPIIQLSQLSRKVDERADHRPTLSDLRESGAIEQDAEAVMFIFRPEYYGVKTDKKGNDLTGLAEIIIAKNRNGETGRAIVRFTPHLTKFEDYNNPELTPGLPETNKVHTENQTDNPTF